MATKIAVMVIIVLVILGGVWYASLDMTPQTTNQNSNATPQKVTPQNADSTLNQTDQQVNTTINQMDQDLKTLNADPKEDDPNSI